MAEGVDVEQNDVGLGARPALLDPVVTGATVPEVPDGALPLGAARDREVEA